MRRSFRSALALLFLLATLFAARAESETVIVPYDPKTPVAHQQPDQRYVPYERFLELWERAKEKRAGVKPEPTPHSWIISSARYDGRVEERGIAFNATLDLTTYNDSWVKVALPFKGVSIGALRIDGVPAALEGDSVLIEKPGRHRVEVAFEVSRARSGPTRWNIPRSSATLVSLRLPQSGMRATIAPGSGSVEQVADGVKTITAALGNTDEVRVEIESAAAAERVVEPAVAQIAPRITVSPGVESTRVNFIFSFPKARQDRFTVHFEKGLTLVDLEAPDVKSWKLAEADGRQSLEVVLNEPADEGYSFAIACERPLPKLPAEIRAPTFSAAAKRLEKGYALFASGSVTLTPAPGAGLRQVPGASFETDAPRIVAAYSGDGALSYRVALAEPRREARVDYVYQVNRRKIELIASMQLFAKDSELFGATLTLPPQFEIQAVESARLQDWWRDGDTLHVRFKDAAAGTTPLLLHLVRLYPAAPTELEVRPLALAGFEKVIGEAVIAAHKGVEAGMRIDGAKETAPDRVATDFKILPPLERKRGFTFTAQNFAAQVTLTALAAKTGALWVMHAQAHESWVSLSTKARVTVRQGSVDRVQFALPAAVPEARVSGGEVRETRSRIDGDRRVYDVQFQGDIHDVVELTIDLELPNPGEIALPAITFPEAQLVTGYVLTDNASDYEMSVKSSGVDPAPSSEIPWLPALSKGAGIHRVQPGWSIAIAVARLEKAAARAAFCAWAQITTALRRDGTEWHRATWRLMNRSLQFLPVRLPAGAELMSARVAGQSVRADTGDTGTILIPLIKTKPGDLSYDVEVVYRTRRGALGWWARREFDDPELPGITVERTFWDIWVPDDRRLRSAWGNMEPVIEEIARTEKLEGMLEELKSLSVIMKSTTSDETRRAARANFDMLCASIEAARPVAQAEVAPENISRKALADQSELAFNKRLEISNELKREVESVGQAGDGSRQQIQTAPVPQLAVQAPAIVALGERWRDNREFAGKSVSTITPAEELSESNADLYFNDAVVLQQRAEPTAEAKPFVGQKGAIETAKKAEPAPQKKVLSSGRSAFAQKEQQIPTTMGGREGETVRGRFAATPVPAALAAAAAPAPTAREAAPQDATRGGAAIAGGTFAGFRITPQQEAQRLQPAGRISLAVDFPTEGRVHHFKKIKAHANLGVSVVAPSVFGRWKYAAGFAGFAVVLLLADRWLARKQRRVGAHTQTVILSEAKNL